MKQNYDTFALMVDCSRNAVLTLNAIKRLIVLLQKIGYTSLLLYTEDTYEVNEEPYFGHLRGRYSKEELKEIVRFGIDHDIEIIPCIQTLAHLDQIFSWPEYEECHDVLDVLLVGEERTSKLLDHIFDTLAECFQSRLVHIGMDEAFGLGLGKYLLKNGFANRQELFLKHLNLVREKAKAHGFDCLMWGDMFFRLASGGEYYDTSAIISQKVIENVPHDIRQIYWDYYHKDKAFYEKMIDLHRSIDPSCWFGGGVWTWCGFAPSYQSAIEVTKPAMEACREKGIKNIIITAWGDNGAETSVFAALPSIFYARQIADGVEDMNLIKKKFEEIVGARYDDFVSLSSIDQIPFPGGTVFENGPSPYNPSKYLMYNDPFLGILDYRENEAFVDHFKAKEKEYAALKNSMGDYGYLAFFYEKLASFLVEKNCLGIDCKEAYAKKDKKGLLNLKARVEKAIEKLDEFSLAYRNAWYHDKKPHGFDVQQLRIGGLKARLEEVQRRIDEYCSGEIESIPEWDEPMLPYAPKDIKGQPSCYNQYLVFASPNRK